MGRIYKPKLSPFYWLDYTDSNGERIRVSTKTTNKKKAQDLLSLRVAEVLKGEEVAPAAARTTFEQVRDNLLSFYRTTGRVKNLDDVADRLAYLNRTPFGGLVGGFGSTRVANISPAMVRAYCEFRREEKVPHKCTASDTSTDSAHGAAPPAMRRSTEKLPCFAEC